MKKVMLLVYLLMMTIVFCCPVKADDKEGAALWYFSSLSVDHKSVRFKLDNVNSAQDATLVLRDYRLGDTIIELPFSIISSSQTFELEVKDGFLPATEYDAYVKDAYGNSTNCWNYSFYEHSYYTGESKAYPAHFTGRLLNYHLLKDIVQDFSFTAEIGFQKYTGTIDSEGYVHIDYPTQPLGTTVIITVDDGYGCIIEEKYEVENKKFSVVNLIVQHDSISISLSEALDDDERVCVFVDGKTFYSDYGEDHQISSDEHGFKRIFTFPDTTSSKLELWFESKYGGSSERKIYEIKDCYLADCEYIVEGRRSQTTGNIKASRGGHIPTQVSINLDGKIYSSTIDDEGNFKIEYPAQNTPKESEIIFSDQHGCTYKKEFEVVNSLAGYTFSEPACIILPTGIKSEGTPEGSRLAVRIGENIYYSNYAQSDNKATVTYPFQSPGTRLQLWCEKADTSKSTETTVTVYRGDYYIYLNPKNKKVSGTINNGDYLYDGIITSAYVIVDGKKYDCEVQKEYNGEYTFVASYPIQKVGKGVYLYISDSNGITCMESSVIGNTPPKIKVDTISSSSTKVSGTTAANASVTIKIGKTVYKCRSNSKGKFSKKIKSHKAGTKVIVTVKTTNGCKGKKNLKVKLGFGYVELKNYVYANSTYVKLNLVGAEKGDKVIVNVSGRNYTETIKSTTKSQFVSVKIGKSKAGSPIKISFTDVFGKRKDSIESMVYFSDAIRVGMSQKNVSLTPWGKPVRRYDWGYHLQWVFESGDTTLYVYIRNGKVRSIQRINY